MAKRWTLNLGRDDAPLRATYAVCIHCHQCHAEYGYYCRDCYESLTYLECQRYAYAPAKAQGVTRPSGTS